MSGGHGLSVMFVNGHTTGSLMARPVHPARAAALRGRWLWLFPASYALHIAEEGRQLLPHPVWRRGIMAGALILGSVALLALPLSHKSTQAMSGT